MTTKEQIQAEIDSINEEYLDDLYAVIKKFAEAKQTPARPTLMSQLREIKIDAPEDFSANIDQYLSGEKHVDPELH